MEKKILFENSFLLQIPFIRKFQLDSRFFIIFYFLVSFFRNSLEITKKLIKLRLFHDYFSKLFEILHFY